MRKFIASLVCLSFLVGGSLATPRGAAPAGPLLMETGQFHGDEVKARTGEQWLGLYVSGGKSSLIPSAVTVERVHDVIVDEDTGVKTGKMVSVKRSPDPVFLIRGADMLRPGPVTTAFVGDRPLTNKSDFRLSLAGVEYRLRVATKDRSPTEAIARDDAKLVLSRDKTSQVLYALGGKGEEIEAWWNLLWAGDLDGDKELDLYVQVAEHYNVQDRRLFLSSQAGRGRLAREIARFRVFGC